MMLMVTMTMMKSKMMMVMIWERRWHLRSPTNLLTCASRGPWPRLGSPLFLDDHQDHHVDDDDVGDADKLN